MTARANATMKDGRFRKAEFSSSPVISQSTPDEFASCYNCGSKIVHAMAHRSLGRNWDCQWHILLVPDDASPPGCSRLPLGHPPSTALGERAKSLRHAVRTISTHRCIFRASFSPPDAGGCGRNLLGNQFVSLGLRSHARGLRQTLDLPRL